MGLIGFEDICFKIYVRHRAFFVDFFVKLLDSAWA
jgi:hypothetical protein